MMDEIKFTEAEAEFLNHKLALADRGAMANYFKSVMLLCMEGNKALSPSELSRVIEYTAFMFTNLKEIDEQINARTTNS